MGYVEYNCTVDVKITKNNTKNKNIQFSTIFNKILQAHIYHKRKHFIGKHIKVVIYGFTGEIDMKVY